MHQRTEDCMSGATIWLSMVGNRVLGGCKGHPHVSRWSVGCLFRQQKCFRLLCNWPSTGLTKTTFQIHDFRIHQYALMLLLLPTQGKAVHEAADCILCCPSQPCILHLLLRQPHAPTGRTILNVPFTQAIATETHSESSRIS